MLRNEIKPPSETKERLMCKLRTTNHVDARQSAHNKTIGIKLHSSVSWSVESFEHGRLVQI